MPRARVVVVGGGISGLAAAWEVSRGGPDVEVTVVEASDRVGGALRSAAIAGHTVDTGAESMLARRPEALGLLAEAGLARAVEHPTEARPSIWSRGRLWPLPAGTLMGVPADPAAARGLLTDAEVRRIEAEGPHHRPVEHDVSVGELVEARVGTAVVDRLVEPLLAGVYAGHARRLSLQASVPPLWTAAREGRSIVAAAADAMAAAGSGPVFAGYRGGLGAMAADLAGRLTRAGVRLDTGRTVRGLHRTATGWELTTGPTPGSTASRCAGPVPRSAGPARREADAVVLATPAAPTRRLLADVAPQAASLLADIECASMAVITLALPRASMPLLGSSGVLVPPTEPLRIKAATFSSAKWQWVDELDPDVVFLRTSMGRAGEASTLQHPDTVLVRAAVEGLEAVLGRRLPPPVDVRVQRWGGALPQYAVGHLERVARILAAVARLPGLEVAGAAYEGVGVPACVGSGRRAGAAVTTHLRDLPRPLGG